MYYDDKTETLRQIFGARTLGLSANHVSIDDRSYPIVDDVIICLPPESWPGELRARLGAFKSPGAPDVAEDIQFTFGEEWKVFREVLPEHEDTVQQYFDLLDPNGLTNARVCDLGCGMGRWSYFISRHCREIVLVDFSEAIFVARHNLRHQPNAVFVMADIRALPFAPDFADVIVCLGVLHHLPTPGLQNVVALRSYAPVLLVYLYYALDNRPMHFRLMLGLVTPIRRLLAKSRSKVLRALVSSVVALAVYRPLIGLGILLRPFGLQSEVPLYDAYHGKSLAGIRQDVYDRFFTPIEQRVTRRSIEGLRRHFRQVTVSNHLPYWHFLCKR
ncbi:MAG: class I SAM-dependent methyltransferase [Candidatus Eisenbacteria bacterium]|uniref:Class I SAM-dependent methyltransferase n=1 Tax=Eiseniibacteriota bacterium TaxID=2212470 RepID=A0A538SG70_UNCEI|nr:MAG: class I SAM-dependent methyltransferase [Candidatus Eisenbacteria bacterium]